MRKRFSFRVVTILAVLAMTALALAVPAQAAKKAKKKPPPPKTFVAEGHFYSPGGLVTQSDFIIECSNGGVPATQGLDAFVVQVPLDFGVSSQATIEATFTEVVPGIQLSFYGYDCSQGELYVEPPASVPAGTGFIVVSSFYSANVDFELTLTEEKS